MNSHENFHNFSQEELQRIQTLLYRMQAISSLLDFFNNYPFSDRQLIDDCQLIVNCLKIDFENSMEALSQIFEVED